MKSRTILLSLIALALVPPALFVGGCLMLGIGAGVLNYRDDANDRAQAAADPRFERPLVSASGRILFIAQKNAKNHVYIVNVDGSGPLNQLQHFSTTVSPDRTRLAIADRGVSIVPLDRPGEPMRLDRPGGSLAWSPDGQQIASLSLDAQKKLHLYLFNADGSGEARDIAATWPSTAAGDEQSVGELSWSPDGKRFAFVLNTRPAFKRSGPRHTHLYIASADGSELKNLSVDPNAPGVGGGLAWSPDGRRLAFGGGRGIAILEPDFSWRDFPAAEHQSLTSQRPAWSPDGTRLAWRSADSIVTSDPDGGRQQELTRGRCRGEDPAWSEDGSRIVFVCGHETGGDLWVMNADGSGLTRITTLGAGKSQSSPIEHYHPSHPVWLPATSP